MEFKTVSQAQKVCKVSYLGSINASSKLAKNGKVSKQHTYGLYLSPAEISGYNTCTHSTHECRLGCLNTSGRAAMDIACGKNSIANARTIKTKILFEQQDFFMQWLIADITGKQRLAINKGYGFSVRLNCTSDIDWANVRYNGLNIFEHFPNIQFYDYTKNPNKFVGIAPNYHLTFSYTGRNWHACKAVLDRGFNIAVVFNATKDVELPTTFNGYNVTNGDLTDYRVADSKGVIVGLKWKRIANRVAEKKVLNSCFVVKI